MKVIIAGGRDIEDYDAVLKAVADAKFDIDTVVSGGATGVDTLALRYARENGIFSMVFPANWKGYGRRAGPMRNQEMAEHADALIAVWDGESTGTKDMINRMVKANKPVHVHLYGKIKTSLDMFYE